MKTYAVKETFLTLQGEGFQAGRRAVFIRFGGCNLWNGRDSDRAKGKGACAMWCDTDFFGGTKWEADALALHARTLWMSGDRRSMCEASYHDVRGIPFVVLTGGEPAMQVDEELLAALRNEGFTVAMETNGTVALGPVHRPDWVTLSPKIGGPILWQGTVDEIKVVLPGHTDPTKGWTEEQLIEIYCGQGFWPRASHYYVQPMDPAVYAPGLRPRSLMWDDHSRTCINFVMRHPEWRVSTQTHKVLQLP